MLKMTLMKTSNFTKYRGTYLEKVGGKPWKTYQIHSLCDEIWTWDFMNMKQKKKVKLHSTVVMELGH
jgi:hypothetical protein